MGFFYFRLARISIHSRFDPLVFRSTPRGDLRGEEKFLKIAIVLGWVAKRNSGFRTDREEKDHFIWVPCRTYAECIWRRTLQVGRRWIGQAEDWWPPRPRAMMLQWWGWTWTLHYHHQNNLWVFYRFLVRSLVAVPIFFYVNLLKEGCRIGVSVPKPLFHNFLWRD